MSDTDLKLQVRSYWDEHPCGTQFTDLVWGSPQFFAAVREERYHRQPFMDRAVGFGRHAGERLLEIGCGLGTDLFEFARGGAEVIGLDLTTTGVALARNRFRQAETPGQFLSGDAEHLPFRDAAFDVVYSFGVLHHTPDTGRAVGEIRRVLRPGGEAIVMLYHSRSSHYYVGYPLALASRLIRGKGWLGKSEYFRIYDGEENPLGKAYTRAQVRTLFGGFEILEQRTYETYRPRRSGLANRVLLGLGTRFGFYLITRARKPAAR